MPAHVASSRAVLAVVAVLGVLTPSASAQTISPNVPSTRVGGQSEDYVWAQTQMTTGLCQSLTTTDLKKTCALSQLYLTGDRESFRALAHRLDRLVDDNAATLAKLEQIRSATTIAPLTYPLPQAQLDALADAIGDRFDAAVADMPTASGGGLPSTTDPLEQAQFRMLLGVLCGLWVCTRIFRMVIPNG